MDKPPLALPTNDERAARASSALDAYAGERYDSTDEASIDLIADLLHHLRRLGYDPERILSQARRHFQHEEEDA